MLVQGLQQNAAHFSSVVGVHVHILSTKVAPLEAINRSEVHLFTVVEAPLVQEFSGAVAIPDVDALVGEELRVGGARDEPEELFRHASPEGALCGEEGKAFPQIETHGAAKEGERSRASAVGLHSSALNGFPD